MKASASLGLCALAVATALVVAAAPLPIYAATLALLGFAHVVVELRYVRDRFGVCLAPRFWLGWGALLLLLMVHRSLAVAKVALPAAPTTLDLALLAALLVATALLAGRERRGLALAAALVGVALLFAVEPALAIALLAIAHNLTPVGFFAERWAADRRIGVDRSREWALVVFAFVAVPAAIALGGAEAAIAAWVDPRAVEAVAAPRWLGFLELGPARDHFGAFLPAGWCETKAAPRLFAMAVYLQCAHYFAVLHVLPRMASRAAIAPPAAGRSRRLVVAGVLVIGALLLARFAASFTGGRALYGIAAAAHAFVEWPLFLAVAIGAARPAPLQRAA